MDRNLLRKYFCVLLTVLATIHGHSQNPLSFAPAMPAINDDILKQSFIYSVKGTDTLGLDVYTLKNEDSTSKKPVIIFVFGGAFVVGKRDDSIYNGYFNHLVENHYPVVSISYRLGLKGVKKVSKFNIKPLRLAVDMAVDDVYDATNWVISRAGQLGIDTSVILLSGSSSGAISVLTAEFERRNGYPASDKLPLGFQYAGLITFSGAILSFKGRLKYNTPPAPKLMFHGTADKIVPYNDIRFFNKGFYGSNWIAKISKENNYPYFLYSEDGMGHEVSVLPMFDNIPEILNFLEDYIVKRKPYQVNLLFKDPNQKPKMVMTSAEMMKKLNP